MIDRPPKKTTNMAHFLACFATEALSQSKKHLYNRLNNKTNIVILRA